MILAFVMILSVFCVVPVSANVIDAPYCFYDFETGTEKPAPASNTTVEIVSDAAYGGSLKGLKITENADKIQSDFAFPAFEIKAYDKVTFTFKYKLATALKADNAEFALMIYDGAKYHTNVFKIAQPADTENWYTATLTANDFENTFTPGAISLRFGTTDAYMMAADEGAKTIYFDDICITREQPTSVLYDFEDNAVPAKLTNSSGWTLSVVNDPLDSNNKVLQHTSGGNPTFRDELTVKAPWTKADSEKMTISLKLFVKEISASAAASLKLRFKIRNTASGYAVGFQDIAFDKTNTSTWQTISTTVTNANPGPDVFDNCTIEINETGGTGSVFLFDDIKYEFERKSYAIPSVADDVTALAQTNGTVVLFDYAYQEKATANPTGTDVSVYKLLTANGGVVNSGKIASGILIPDTYRNESLILEIIPVSSTGIFGDSVVINNISEEYDIDLQESDITFTSDGVKAEVRFEHLYSGGTTANALFIVCAYDANGALIDYGVASIVCAPGAVADADLVADGVQNPEATVTAANIDSAKAFLWNCEETPTDVFNTTMIQLCESVSAQKN